MNEAIGQTLSLGVGVTLSPIPIVAVVLMLATPRARSNGPAFLLGWVTGLSLVGALVFLVSGGADAGADQAPATWVSVLKLILGAAALLLAGKQWQGRPRGEQAAPLPKWMQTIDDFGPAKSFGVAVLLSAVNPKNLLLTVAAAATIAATGIDAGQQALSLAVFVVIGALGPGAPIAVYFVLGERSRALLEDLKTWMAAHNAVILAVLMLVIGAKLLGDGLAGL